ncbi:MAG: choice-of-anchor D domain-containing protein [candidate division KSB1 bacterium]|nr:choice-of-anchor D domain-containing protein [candidate division KSB1 bacterium]
MKSFRLPIALYILALTAFLINANAFAGTVSRLSNIFPLDTRVIDYPPVDGWQLLTDKGDTYHEDMVIDNFGKVWCFYFRSNGAGQPVYLKIFQPNGYVYKREQIVGFGASESDPKYQSIRAALNSLTGDVWVAIQGKQGGYFVIFDSTGTVKKDSTVIDKAAFLPKITAGRNGKMWISWHNQIQPNADSQGKLARYSTTGTRELGPNNIGQYTYVFNTDIAADDSGRVWAILEVNQSNSYSTKMMIFNENLSTYKEGITIADHAVPVSLQRQLYSDPVNQRMWILEKNVDVDQQKLHQYLFSGTRVATIETVGNCSFIRNERNYLEVIKFNPQNAQNKTYDVYLYYPTTGGLYTSKVKFDSTYQFVQNCVAFNRNYPTLKAYVVQLKSNLTKVKFESVSPGQPQIAAKSVNFDTTKIIPNYSKLRVMRVENKGDEILRVFKVIPHDPDFSVSDTTFTILPSQYRDINVVFKPTREDTIVDYILFLSNDPKNDSLKVTVSGRGYRPTIPIITVDEDTLQFEQVVIGNSQIKYIYVYNDDRYEPLKISRIKSSNSQFTTTDSLGFVLNPKKGKYVGVTFRPIVVGDIEGFLTIQSNDTLRPNLRIVLRGKGIRYGTPRIAVTPDTLKFGAVALGSQKSIYLAIDNTGDNNLEIYNITAADSQYRANMTRFIIPPRGRAYVLITYYAQRLGSANTQLDINSSDLSIPDYFIPIFGSCRKAAPPEISISADTLKFGTVAIGASKTAYFNVSNRGEESLYVRGIKSSDPRYAAYPSSVTIQPGYTSSIAVTFTPNAVGTIKGHLMIVSNDVQRDTLFVYLTGSGRELTNPKMELSVQRIDFGQVATNQSLTKTFTISNSGEKTLEISKLSIKETNSPYSVTPNVLSVPYGQYRTVSVTFTPKQIGLFSGTVTITTNEPGNREIPLSGTGRDPLPQNIAVSQTQVSFDSVALNQSSSRYIWVKNTGERALNVQSIVTTDSSFIPNTSAFTLPPGNTRYILITFTPKERKTYQATLRIQSDDPDNQNQNIALSGYGRLLRNQNIVLSAASLSFGEVPVTQQRSYPLTISNTGEKDLTVTNVSTRTTNFAVNTSALVVGPQSYQTIYVTFTPKEVRNYSDTLTIANNDPETPIVRVLLQGVGRTLRDQQLAVQPNQLNFGSVGAGLAGYQNLQIRNDGEMILKIDNIKSSSDNFSFDFKQPIEISPSNAIWLVVTFRPDSIGKFEADLTIYSNDPLHNALKIPMLGEGRELLPPNISIYPNQFDFGSVALGRNKTAQFSISNQGEKELIINSIVPNNDQFTADKHHLTIAPWANQLVNLTFQPKVLGKIEAELIVTSNDPDSSVMRLPLSGTGRTLLAPQLAYSPKELNFGQVELGQKLTNYLTVQNLGDLPLKLIAIQSRDPHFVVSQDSLLLEGGQSHQLAIQFTPTDTVEIRSTLEIKSNDPSNYLIYVPVTGKGKGRTQQIIVSPEPVDFKQVLIRSTATAYLWVANLGQRPLTISNIESNNKHFKPQLTNFLLEYNSSRQVPITFTPDSIKTFKAKLTILSDDPVLPSKVVDLIGTGRDSIDQQITIFPDSLNFDKVALRTTKALVLTINNIGEKYLKITSVTAKDPSFKPNLTSLQVAPKSSGSIIISFTPTTAKIYRDTLKIVSNDPKRATLLVKLSGTGREPTQQQLVLPDTLLNFGTVPTDRSKSLLLTIRNSGEQNLEIIQLATSDAQFSVKDNLLMIGAGQSAQLLVSFSPTKAGSFTAYLNIKSNDPKKPDARVRLIGNGVVYTGAKVAVSPQSLNFGELLIGAVKRLPLWIYNESTTADLKIDSISINNQAFRISKKSATIKAGSNLPLQVEFQPLFQGNQYGQATIYTNDQYQKLIQVSLFGIGIAEKVGQNVLAQLGWKIDGYTPVGDFFSPAPHTDSLLSDAPDRAWFIKDIMLSKLPTTSYVNICFDDYIQLYINGALVLIENSTQPIRWNIANRDIKQFLRLGRNRISVLVWNKQPGLGAFDCELIVDNEPKIRRGDQNWTHADATWWYYGAMGKEYPTPPPDSPYDRLWFHSDYGIAGSDTLEAQWVFEPTGSDTLYDNSPYGKKAILHNVKWVQGVIGQAMQFAGSKDSYAELYANINKIPQFIELWVNCYGAKQHIQNIITNKGTAEYGQGLFISKNMKLGVYYYNGILETKFTINPGTWYYVSTFYRWDKVWVYVNNVLVDSISYTQGIPVGSNICYLGGNPVDTDSVTAFYGAIDELKIRATDTMPTLMPAVAQMTPSVPDSSAKGTKVQLKFDIYPAPYKILTGIFEYAFGGSENYRRKTLSFRDSTFTSALQLAIPADSATIRGLKYRVSIQTNYGEVKYPSENQSYSWITVKTERESSNVVLPRRIHRMISVPYELDDPSVEAVLADNFGQVNPYQWRLFDWSQKDTSYVAYGDSAWQNRGAFSRGKAFWLITSQQRSYDAGAGRSPGNENYRIVLNPGWNMIGNPFPYPVRWSDIQKTSELISSPIYRSTIDSIGWIYSTQVIQPWEGYFVWNGDNVSRSLIVPPKEAPRGSLSKPKSAAVDYLEKYSDLAVLISATVRCGQFIDNDNLCGLAETADNEFDPCDLMEAPAIGDYVSLSINNKSWSNHPGRYAIDIRKLNDDGCAWPLELDYSLERPDRNMIIRFAPVTELPPGWRMFLFDESQDVAIDLQSNSTIVLNPIAGKNVSVYYKLVIGTEAFLRNNSNDIPLVPLEFELFQNYPNPFNAATTISFNLPKRMHVSLKIYNILGQLVKTLLDEEVKGGNHKIIWDATNDQGQMIATGVYIIQLRSQQNVAIKKLVVIK